MLYARNVHFTVKNGKVDEFKKLLNSEVIPLLKKQKGFRDEVAMFRDHSGLAVSLWTDRTSADAYQSATYPEVLKKLTPILETTPKVETYEVPVTTMALA